MVITIMPEKVTKTPKVFCGVNGSLRNAAESSIANIAWRLIMIEPSVADMNRKE